MSQTNLISAKSIEKLIQIGQMSGNININGNFNQIIINVGENLLSQVGNKNSFPNSNYKEVIANLISKFNKNVLLDIDTCKEIILLLYLHPDPEPSVRLLYSQRPIQDLISMTMWIPPIHSIEKKYGVLKSMGIDSDEKYRELKKTFEKRHDFSEGIYSSKFLFKISNQFMELLQTDKTLARDFIDTHPEIFDLHVDQILAALTVAHSDEKESLDFIQDSRQFLYNAYLQRSF